MLKKIITLGAVALIIPLAACGGTQTRTTVRTTTVKTGPSAAQIAAQQQVAARQQHRGEGMRLMRRINSRNDRIAATAGSVSHDASMTEICSTQARLAPLVEAQRTDIDALAAYSDVAPAAYRAIMKAWPGMDKSATNLEAITAGYC